MSLDVMDTLDWIRRMPMSRRMDANLKRERALELLSKRAERVIGGFARSHGQQSKVIRDLHSEFIGLFKDHYHRTRYHREVIHTS